MSQNSPPPPAPAPWARTAAALGILAVWLGLVVYDALSAAWEMPLLLWGLGIADVTYLLGVSLPRLLASGNGRPPTPPT